MTLRSLTNLQVLDILCEGPIEGLVGDKKGIYLNDVPLQDANGVDAHEFSQVTAGNVFFRPGTANQNLDYIKSAVDENSNTVTVNKRIGENYFEVTDSANQVKSRNYGEGIVFHTISDSSVDSIQLLFTVARLYSTVLEGSSQGRLMNASIDLTITLTDRNGSTFASQQKILTGIVTSNYQCMSKEFDVSSVAFPVHIKVQKHLHIRTDANYRPHIEGETFQITTRKSNVKSREAQFQASYLGLVDTMNPKTMPLANGRGNDIFLTAVVTSKKTLMAYRYTSINAMTVSATAYTSLPQRSYLIKGKKVRIPSNATVHPDGYLEFNGDFDGSLSGGLHWTTCPVCIWYDMATDNRSGAGNFIKPEDMNWVDLYPLCKYANEILPATNGRPAEPRFACNVVIGAKAPAYQVLQDLASVFRGMTYYHANFVALTADHGELGKTDGSASVLPPVHIFTNSNVVDGLFSYEGSSLKTRSSSIKVRYNDPENLYKPDFVCVENPALRSKYGLQEREIIGVGCTSKHQAARMGRWMLAAEELNGNTVKFATGLDGGLVLPGQVFAVADELKQSARIAGRIRSGSTTSVINIDGSLTLPAIDANNTLGSNPKLTISLKHGTIEERPITYPTDATTSTNAIHVSPAFTEAPVAENAFSIKVDELVEQKFRCVSVSDNGDGTFAILGVQHNDSIYAVADTETFNLTSAPTVGYKEGLNVPRNPNIDFRREYHAGNLTYGVLLSWDAPIKPTNTYWVQFYIDGVQVANEERTNQFMQFKNVPLNSDCQLWVYAWDRAENAYSKPAYATETAPNSLAVDTNLDTKLDKFFAVPNVGTNVEQFDNIHEFTTDSDLELSVVLVPGNDDEASAPFAVNATFTPPSEIFYSRLQLIVRHSESLSGTWAKSVELDKLRSINSGAIELPFKPGLYLFKYFDKDTNTFSPTAVTRSVDYPPGYSVGQSIDDDLYQIYDLQQHNSGTNGNNFTNGHKTGVQTELSNGVLCLKMTENVRKRGQYFFPDEIDLGGTYEVFLDAQTVNDPLDEAHAATNRTSCRIFYRSTTREAPSSDGLLDEGGSDLLAPEQTIADSFQNPSEYEEWENITPIKGFTSVFARRLRFVAVLSRDVPVAGGSTISPRITNLSVRIYVRKRVEYISNQQTALLATDNFGKFKHSFHPLAGLPAFRVLPTRPGFSVFTVGVSALETNQFYIIAEVGNTTWTNGGATSSTVGHVFKYNGTSLTGTGRAEPASRVLWITTPANQDIQPYVPVDGNLQTHPIGTAYLVEAKNSQNTRTVNGYALFAHGFGKKLTPNF